MATGDWYESNGNLVDQILGRGPVSVYWSPQYLGQILGTNSLSEIYKSIYTNKSNQNYGLNMLND